MHGNLFKRAQLKLALLLEARRKLIGMDVFGKVASLFVFPSIGDDGSGEDGYDVASSSPTATHRRVAFPRILPATRNLTLGGVETRRKTRPPNLSFLAHI